VTEFRLLGPLEVADGDATIAGRKPRALLAILLLEANRAVPVDRLIDELWPEDPPETATKTLQVYVSQLRAALGADRVETRGRAYAIRVAGGELDTEWFASLLERARGELAGGDADAATSTLREALALWRGPALADFRGERFADEAAARFEELRLAATEVRIEAELELGRHAALIGELEQLAAEHPHRERLRAQLMLALYRSGRQADALDVYRRTRAEFADELGIEPGPELRQLERQILGQEAELGATSLPLRMRLPIVRGLDPAIVLLASGLAAAAVAAGVITIVKSVHRQDVTAYVTKVENLLEQAHDGRSAVVSTIGAATSCRISPKNAAARLNTIQQNRQSILQQIAALRVPNDRLALRTSSLLQRAMSASIAADFSYLEWLAAQDKCSPGMRPPPAVLAADARSTQRKRAFVQPFNYLAWSYGQKTWNAAEF
jgi:DNA-binding SARP family transcriptional activator